MRIAVIDLGTNTCNLLIAEPKSAGYKILHQSKQLVKLGDDRIRNNEISEEATKRVLQSLLVHKATIDKFDVDRIKVLATSAVRDASNKTDFLNLLTRETGWIIEVVSGETEAELIFKGVLLAIKEFKEPAIILDIGGGSNELILASGKDMIWKESRPAGMARVINRFELSDPIQTKEINLLQKFFSAEHYNAFLQCRGKKVKTLLGCSGAFDTIADMIDQVNPGEKTRISQEISLPDFYSVFSRLIKSTRDERIQLKGMDMVRIDLIIPAVILIEHLISSLGITRIIQTDFALREGAFYDMMNK